MRKWKRKIVDKYLPAWCREEIIDENKRLTEKVAALGRKIELQDAYIDGVHDALRYRPKIEINGKGDTR